MVILGYFLAVLVGVSLGLIGSGGSILTVPILVYIMGVDPVLATAYSLFIVGVTALVGGVQNALLKNVDFTTALIFGVPSVAAVYGTRAWVVPHIPQHIFWLGDLEVTKPVLLMLLFAVIMVAASVSMIRPSRMDKIESAGKTIGQRKYNFPMILLEGTVVGVLTGLVGAGGGFLIIPALVLFSRMPMKLAIGTSLFIIAAKSLIGFTGDLRGAEHIDWTLLGTFTLMSVVGIFIGILLSKRISGKQLKVIFGWFVLVMGCYIILNILKELFL